MITGKAKGRRLKSVKGMNTRPTTDRVKESLFSIIGSRVYDTVFLDLFSGTGAIGIEALSRGAKAAILVERDRRALSVIRENLGTTNLKEAAVVMGMDVRKALPHLAEKGYRFGIVFMDPPYRMAVIPEVLEQLQYFRLLEPKGLVVCEHSKDENLPDGVGSLRLIRQQVYGDTCLSFFEDTEG